MFTDFNKFIMDLQTAINGESEAIEFYNKLLEIAPCEEARDFIRHIRDDEMKHYRMFTQLYISLCGRPPVVMEPQVRVTEFCRDVKKAVKDELEAAELYRSMLLSTTNMRIRDIMFETMTDEMEHATRLTFIYSMSDCHEPECETGTN